MASELERATWIVEKGMPAVEKDIPDLKVRVAKHILDTNDQIDALDYKVQKLEEVVDRFFRETSPPEPATPKKGKK
jgi:hypothetical protein